MTQQEFDNLLFRHSESIEDFKNRINDLEVPVDNLKVQLATHDHAK